MSAYHVRRRVYRQDGQDQDTADLLRAVGMPVLLRFRRPAAFSVEVEGHDERRVRVRNSIGAGLWVDS